jgi:hypothetical protein
LEIRSIFELYRCQFETIILKYGGVLFRGLNLSKEEFAKLSAILYGGKEMFHNYDDGISPRTDLYQQLVFTSTEYSNSQEIFQHNEMSYSHMPPPKITFYCEIPSSSGGQTPIASSREMMKVMKNDPLIIPLLHQDITYRTVLSRTSFGLGKSWEETYSSSDKFEVERKLKEMNIQFEWENDTLITTRTLPIVRRHPVLDEEVWFNHAHLFHTSSLGSQVESQLDQLKLKPKSCFLSNGMEISRDVIFQILANYKKAEHCFDWRKGDMLMLDNYLMSHGRLPFDGNRSIWVSLSK